MRWLRGLVGAVSSIESETVQAALVMVGAVGVIGLVMLLLVEPGIASTTVGRGLVGSMCAAVAIGVAGVAWSELGGRR